jgi:hypothetical protein
MPRRSSHPFDLLVDRFAQLFAERIAAALPSATPRNGAAVARGSPRGLKRGMSCRYPGCKNRSKGPRFRFLCEEHLKLPKKKQDEVLAKWAERSPSLAYEMEATRPSAGRRFSRLPTWFTFVESCAAF